MDYFIPRADLDYKYFKEFSALHLYNLTSDHVGRYTCYTKKRKRKRIRRQQQFFFLFVYDSDNPAAFPPTPDVLSVSGFIGESAILPCIPAHPSFDVSLRRKSIPMPEEEYTFEPHKGFELPNVTGEEMGGDYDCLFSSLHAFEQKRTVHLFVEKPFPKKVDLDEEDILGVDGEGLDPDGNGSGSNLLCSRSAAFIVLLVVIKL